MTILLRSALASLLALSAAACKKESEPARSSRPDPAPAAQTTTTEEAPPVAASAAGGAKPGAYDVDPVHSFVLFKIRHFDVGYAYGEFNQFKGSFKVDPDPTKSSIEIVITADSIDTHDAKRDAHLKSPDFFNAKQFPTITFKSSEIGPAGAEGWSDLKGDLTIRGKTKPVTLQIRPVGAGVDAMKTYRVGYEARGTIKRMDFDVAFMPGALGDDVELILAIEGVPAK
jgi:polyisoprenoid-binding protein YceI